MLLPKVQTSFPTNFPFQKTILKNLIEFPMTKKWGLKFSKITFFKILLNESFPTKPRAQPNSPLIFSFELNELSVKKKKFMIQ